MYRLYYGLNHNIVAIPLLAGETAPFGNGNRFEKRIALVVGGNPTIIKYNDFRKMTAILPLPALANFGTNVWHIVRVCNHGSEAYLSHPLCGSGWDSTGQRRASGYVFRGHSEETPNCKRCLAHPDAQTAMQNAIKKARDWEAEIAYIEKNLNSQLYRAYRDGNKLRSWRLTDIDRKFNF
jgi:hypothetical protein